MRSMLRAAQAAYVRNDHQVAASCLLQAFTEIVWRMPLKRRISYLRELINGMFEGFEELVVKRGSKQKKKAAARLALAKSPVVH